MQITNPATEEVKTVEETPAAAIPEIVAQAKRAQKLWASKPVAERIAILSPLLKVIESRGTELCRIIAADMGKPVSKAQREIKGSVDEAGYIFEHAKEWLEPEKVSEGFVEFAPLGIAAVISPWNYPLLLPLRGIIPALIAGNSVIFKPSEHALQIGIEIDRMLNQLSGLPQSVFQTIIGGKEHGSILVDQDVALISFTGSTAVGKDIMSRSSRSLKRVLLELGGLDAAIVLKDADPKTAAAKIVQNNCNNSGQVCCAIKRVYVEKEIYPQFVDAAVAAAKAVKVGNPLDDVEMGPLVAKFQIEKVEKFVEDAKREGATVRTGGARPSGKGYFYPPTILTDVSHDTRVMREEPFGPVLPIMPVDSWEHAVEFANDTRYGLAGSVWTNDLERAREIASRLEVGVAGINVHGSGGLGVPWGGAKESGIGRMKTREGLREYTNIKLVRIQQL